MSLNKLTIKEAAKSLREGKFSSVALTQACLNRIKERNDELNAFITVAEKSALAEAKKADEMIQKKEGNELTGIPFSVKDAICTKDIRSTGAGKILDNYTPPFDATVIAKIRHNGGVLIGKNNCDTFGHGASNENSMYGCVKNPYNLKKVSGGSSGGSAVAVADNMCIYSIAEDTGGSIRQPASFCGLIGLRPSYGRNSRFGIMPMASSLDTVGPITKTIEDCAIVEKNIAGKDEKDATTVNIKVPDYTKELDTDLKGLKVGIPKEYFEIDGLDQEVKEITEKKIEELRKLGCEIKEVSLPYTKYAIAVYYILVPSEDSSNLARLDGIRYGVRNENNNLVDIYTKSRAKGFPEEVKRRIMIGTYTLSAGYYDAYYKKAQTVRTLIKKDFKEVFEKVDCLITPTSPYPAFDIGDKINNVLSMYLADVFVSPSAVAGMPAMSVPVGLNSKKLPVGIQLIGDKMNEEILFKIGYHISNN